MSFDVRMITDSISPDNIRLATLQLRYPRYIHAELMTHRIFSRNASSSRAIPVAKMAQMALADMVEPIRWGRNQPGMQAHEQDLEGTALVRAQEVWRRTAEACAAGAQELAELGLHKQWANRMLEWFGHISVVVTATEWDNWFDLRAHPAAQPEIQHLACLMRDVMTASMPRPLSIGTWHLPYVQPHEFADYGDDIELLKKVSAARCCRVSYLRHDGEPATVQEDLDLCEKLAGSRPIHASPFEHQATPDIAVYPNGRYTEWSHPHLHGNFTGWVQYRKQIEASFS